MCSHSCRQKQQLCGSPLPLVVFDLEYLRLSVGYLQKEYGILFWPITHSSRCEWPVRAAKRATPKIRCHLRFLQSHCIPCDGSMLDQRLQRWPNIDPSQVSQEPVLIFILAVKHTPSDCGY